jgi:hypothetical protein
MNLIKTALQVGDSKYLSPRAFAAFAAICISAVHCTPVWCDLFQIDINSLGSPTEAGWTGLNATNGGNGSGVTVDGVTFRVHAADGHRDRSAPNHLTRDFVFNDGPDQQVGLSISGLADALWRAEVWAWDAWYPTDLGPLIVGVTHVPFTGDWKSCITDDLAIVFGICLLLSQSCRRLLQLQDQFRSASNSRSCESRPSTRNMT